MIDEIKTKADVNLIRKSDRAPTAFSTSFSEQNTSKPELHQLENSMCLESLFTQSWSNQDKLKDTSLVMEDPLTLYTAAASCMEAAFLHLIRNGHTPEGFYNRLVDMYPDNTAGTKNTTDPLYDGPLLSQLTCLLHAVLQRLTEARFLLNMWCVLRNR